MTDGLIFAVRMLLCTNSEKMVKIVTWFLFFLSKSCEDKLFTRAYLAENVVDLLSPIAQKKVTLSFIPQYSILIAFCSIVFSGLLCGRVLWPPINRGHQLYGSLWGNRRYTQGICKYIVWIHSILRNSSLGRHCSENTDKENPY